MASADTVPDFYVMGEHGHDLRDSARALLGAAAHRQHRVPLAKMEIRAYRETDYAEACAILAEVGEETVGPLAKWQSEFSEPEGLFFTALLDGRIAGYGAMTDEGNGRFVLHTDVVSPAFQKQGVGSALVLARIAAMDGPEPCRCVLLATQHSCDFYARFGFQSCAPAEWDTQTQLWLRPMERQITKEDIASARSLLAQRGIMHAHVNC